MAKRSLVVVESPTKVKTIQKYLDGHFVVKASMGHVRDLPKSRMGVDFRKKSIKVDYVVTPTKKKILEDLKKAAEKVDTLYVATDPDREGEAIGWHLAEELAVDKKRVYRVTFNEITERAVRAAFEHPGKIDLKKVDAQQARRVLDRLVGYKLSPLLWDKLQRGLSAGRVQSVAVRLIVDREREIETFVPEEYWSLHARLTAPGRPEFEATLREVDGEKPALPNEAATRELMASLEGATFRVRSVTRGERRRNPAAPFITSTLQQEAGRRLGFSAKKTMTVAQQLYEGVELPKDGQVGLITYMRTDSVQVSADAQQEARAVIGTRWGQQYLPDTPPAYRSRGRAQEAHEAIRPADIRREPRSVARALGKDQLALYRLIWERFMASQMVPAVYDTVSADIEAVGREDAPAGREDAPVGREDAPVRTVFRALGSTLRFDGFMAVYVESREDEAPAEEEATATVPPLEEGEALSLLGLDPRQHFTQAPPRYTEASLIKALEELGIGRPSTYAQILSTIINDRGYVHRERRTLFPTELGIVVTDLLKPYFPEIMDVEFTAQMETELDKVEDGDIKWAEAIGDFYSPFERDLKRADKEMPNLKAGDEVDEQCPECGKPLLRRWGSSGMFLGCAGYPDCRYTKNLSPGGWRMEEEPTDEVCPRCAKPMVIKHGRFGRFIACTGYPDCRTTKPITMGIPCPEPGCQGQIAQRRSRRGKVFYGCSAYPDCKFVVWNRPIAEPCPRCQAPFVVERTARGGRHWRACSRPGCDYKSEVETTVA